MIYVGFDITFSFGWYFHLRRLYGRRRFLCHRVDLFLVAFQVTPVLATVIAVGHCARVPGDAD